MNHIERGVLAVAVDGADQTLILFYLVGLITMASPVEADGLKVQVICKARWTDFGNLVPHFPWPTSHDSNIWGFAIEQNSCNMQQEMLKNGKKIEWYDQDGNVLVGFTYS